MSQEDTFKPSMKRGKYSQKEKDVFLEAISILPPQRLARNRLIMRIVNECLAKLKLSIVIPKIFENPLTVYRALKGTEYEQCATLLLDYLKGRNKDEEIVVTGPHCYDDKLIKVINHFHENYKVLELLPNWFTKTTVSDHSIMDAFNLLSHIVDQRMHRSAQDELEKEKEMHSFFRENVALRKQIDALRRVYRSQKQQERSDFAFRFSDNKYQNELAGQKWQYFNFLRQAMLDNAHRIKQLNHGLAGKVSQLEDEIKRLESEFKKLKITNAKQLKNVREEKNKLLIQLQLTIERHDRVLGEKIKENVYLQDEYDKQREEMDSFMVGYSALEKEYNDIVQAEIEEEESKWQIRADLFFKTRAARIIQRYWRQYLVLIKKQKKGRKSSQGKEDMKKRSSGKK